MGIWNLVKALKKTPQIINISKDPGKDPQWMYFVAVSSISTQLWQFAQVNDVVLCHILRLTMLVRQALATP